MTKSILGFVFPGQGSQSQGMLSELVHSHSLVKQTFEQASEVLALDIWDMIENNPDGKLDLTENTQPALLTASVAIFRLWKESGGTEPVVVAGHSLGEYSALVCAEALSFEDGIRLVADRGRFMQEAVSENPGVMAAILGLDDDVVSELCDSASTGESVVSAANFNSPSQVVIAGHQEAVERAINIAMEKGAKRAMPLAVSVPSHCILMANAAKRLSERLEEVEIKDTKIPIVQNVDAVSRTDAVEIKQALVKQLHQSVHWWKSIQTIREMSISSFIECGPGKVLAGLTKRIDRSLSCYSVNDQNSLNSALEETKND